MLDTATATAPFGVLVIEIGTGWTDLVTDSLRREGILVSIAAGGASALLEIVAKAQPQMIILELGGSVAETLATCRMLRSVSQAHIAVLAADVAAATAAAEVDAGIDEVIRVCCTDR